MEFLSGLNLAWIYILLNVLGLCITVHSVPYFVTVMYKL